MVLTPQEESLIGMLRQLSADEAGKVLQWAHQLRKLAGTGAVEWSDAWSEEDRADATRAALERFDAGDRDVRQNRDVVMCLLASDTGGAS